MDATLILALFKRAVQEAQIVLSLHAAEEALAEHIARPEMEEVLSNAQLLEDYPDWCWAHPV